MEKTSGRGEEVITRLYPIAVFGGVLTAITAVAGVFFKF
jgi:hypothetical protein